MPVLDECSPVNRTRRFVFVCVIVGFCLSSSIFMALFGPTTALTETVVEGQISLALGATLAYLGASAADYYSASRRGRPIAAPAPREPRAAQAGISE